MKEVPKPLSGEMIRYLHQKAKQNAEKKSRGDEKTPLLKTTLNSKLYVSKTELRKLSLTTIPELNFQGRYTGRHILVRVLEPWYSMTSLNTVVEDHRGNVVRLALYNYPLDEMFYRGDILFIKEPLLKIARDGMTIIRCDCPTDIMLLRLDHCLHYFGSGMKWMNDLEEKVNPLMAAPVPTCVQEWNDRGTQLLARRQFTLARAAFNFGLQRYSDGNPILDTIRLNLLEVQLCLGYYEWVVEKGERFLEKIQNEEKAYYRLGSAYYKLRNYKKAWKTFKRLLEKFPGDRFGLMELEKAENRIRESRGEIDFEKLRRVSIAKPIEVIDCADFWGPVKIVRFWGKMRGLVVTENVNKNSVLLVSKALVAYLTPVENPCVLVYPGERTELGRDLAANLAQLVELVMKNPETIGEQVYDLYSGEFSRERYPLFCDLNSMEPICDVELLKKIVGFNRFEIVERLPNGGTNCKGSGLFLLSSYINHSWSPNAEVEFYNNVMVVKTLKNLKEGAEVTVAYIPKQFSFEDRLDIAYSGIEDSNVA